MRDLRVSTRQPYGTRPWSSGRDGARRGGRRLDNCMSLDPIPRWRKERGLPRVLRPACDPALAGGFPSWIDLMAEFTTWWRTHLDTLTVNLAAVTASGTSDFNVLIDKVEKATVKEWQAGSFHVWMEDDSVFGGPQNTVTEVHEPCRNPYELHHHEAYIYAPNGKVLHHRLMLHDEFVDLRSIWVGGVGGDRISGDRTIIVGCLMPSDPWADHAARMDRPPETGVWLTGWPHNERFYALIGPCHAGPTLWKVKMLDNGDVMDLPRVSLGDMP